jgi:hypothetical protein
MLSLAIVVSALALTMEVLPDERVALSTLPGYPLPPLCMSQNWFGVACPGCGLTRSFVYLAHGQWEAAWQIHRLGWLVAAALLLQIPYRALCLWSNDRFRLSHRLSEAFGMALICLLIGNWVVEQFR